MRGNGKTCLVVDDAPGVGHHMVVVCGEGVVAGPGGAKGVAQHLHLPPAPTLQPLAHVIGCQGRQSPTQRMPCSNELSDGVSRVLVQGEMQFAICKALDAVRMVTQCHDTHLCTNMKASWHKIQAPTTCMSSLNQDWSLSRSSSHTGDLPVI